MSLSLKNNRDLKSNQVRTNTDKFSDIDENAKQSITKLNKISVDIFGTLYTIKGEATPEYIFSLAKYVNDKMSEIASYTANMNVSKVAILAALNIADEYIQHKQLSEIGMAKVVKKAKNMISMLDQGIIGDIYE